jgi:gamma-glutamyltranspeptidase/glutathione hydrolase
MESELLRNIKPKLLILILIVSFIGASLLLTCPIYAVVIKGNKWIVASRYPEATEAAALMLQQGGNAFDAAVAGLAVLGIVDPLISGLGAEVFALVYSAEENKVISINGGGMAPKAATIEWYLKSDQNPLNTGLIPGALDVWVTMVDKWGVMKLEEVLTPAIKLAEGWKVSEALAQILANEDIKEKLSRFASSRELYYKEDGSPYLAGEVMLNQDLANTMKRIIIAEQQATAYCACRGDNHRHQAMINARDCFYKGSIAKDFGEFFKAHEIPFTYFDMVSYHALLETPAHINYRGYDIYTCPSANQGPAELEALNIMEKFNLVSLEYNTAQSIHLMAEAINLAYADRERYSEMWFPFIPLSVIAW